MEFHIAWNPWNSMEFYEFHIDSMEPAIICGLAIFCGASSIFSSILWSQQYLVEPAILDILVKPHQ